MILSQIAAMSSNRVIGIENTLPWNMPEDLKYFKQMTKNKIMIMGRKTFDSLPGHLPHRYHIVISRADIVCDEPDLVFVKSIDEAIQKAKSMISAPNNPWGDEIMIVGGAEIYKQTLPLVDRIYLTVIEKSFDGDAHFPEFDTTKYTLTTKQPEKPSDVKFEFRVYEKKKN